MTKATITLLGRATVDAPFEELASSTVVVGAAAVACTPAVPSTAADQELALRVLADDTVNVAVGMWLDPAALPAPAPIKDAQGNVVGEEPAPIPTARGRYVAWGRAPRVIPFAANHSIVLSRSGVPPIVAVGSILAPGAVGTPAPSI